MADWMPPTQDRVEAYFKELNNWGRWGHDDQRGTANLITAAKRAQAHLLVRTGRTVSLARDIGPQPAIMYNVTFPSNRERADVVLDRFDLVYHGFTITHIDALCHVAWDGELYNGRSFKDSLTAAGANPERLARACAEEGRYEFLFTATPIRLVGSTGAPAHPLAIF